MVLKAAERSRKWELIIWKTVSVEWMLLNPNWSLPIWLFCERTRQYLVVNNSFKCLRQVCTFLQVQVPLAVGLSLNAVLQFDLFKGATTYFCFTYYYITTLHQKHYYVIIFHIQQWSVSLHKSWYFINNSSCSTQNKHNPAIRPFVKLHQHSKSFSVYEQSDQSRSGLYWAPVWEKVERTNISIDALLWRRSGADTFGSVTSYHGEAQSQSLLQLVSINEEEGLSSETCRMFS